MIEGENRATAAIAAARERAWRVWPSRRRAGTRGRSRTYGGSEEVARRPIRKNGQPSRSPNHLFDSHATEVPRGDRRTIARIHTSERAYAKIRENGEYSGISDLARAVYSDFDFLKSKNGQPSRSPNHVSLPFQYLEKANERTIAHVTFLLNTKNPKRVVSRYMIWHP